MKKILLIFMSLLIVVGAVYVGYDLLYSNNNSDGGNNSSGGNNSGGGNNPVLTGITLSKSIKTSYRLGEEIDLNDAKIVAHFNNDTTEEITILESMITDFDTTTTGSRNLKITYIGHIITKNYSVSGLKMGKYIEVNQKFYLDGELVYTMTNPDTFFLFSSDNVAKVGRIFTNTVSETGTWNYDLDFNVTLEIMDSIWTIRIIDSNNLEITFYSGDPIDADGVTVDLCIMYLEYSSV